MFFRQNIITCEWDLDNLSPEHRNITMRYYYRNKRIIQNIYSLHWISQYFWSIVGLVELSLNLRNKWRHHSRKAIRRTYTWRDGLRQHYVCKVYEPFKTWRHTFLELTRTMNCSLQLLSLQCNYFYTTTIFSLLTAKASTCSYLHVRIVSLFSCHIIHSIWSSFKNEFSK